jgi:photosystem II stability/assembly factor-like uncharacterized protein
VFKSIDGGASWAASGLNGVYDAILALDPQQPAVIYAADGFSFKTTNGGVSWRRIRIPHGGNEDLAVDPYQPRGLYAATDSGIFESTDGGARWRSLGLTSATALAFGPKAVYAGSDGGVFMSTTAGQPWRLVGANGKLVESVAVSKSGRILYAATDDGDVYRFRLHE